MQGGIYHASSHLHCEGLQVRHFMLSQRAVVDEKALQGVDYSFLVASVLCKQKVPWCSPWHRQLKSLWWTVMWNSLIGEPWPIWLDDETGQNIPVDSIRQFHRAISEIVFNLWVSQHSLACSHPFPLLSLPSKNLACCFMQYGTSLAEHFVLSIALQELCDKPSN